MKTYVSIGAVICLLLSILSSPCTWGSSPPIPGQLLPRFDIPAPQTKADAQYLGVEAKDRFWVGEINAPLVIIEIFSMYCPFCQREAPRVNQLYNKIESNPELKGKIKILGIGVGNTPFEVNFFKKKFKVPFPMFPDKDFSIHKTLGEVRTPYFIVVSNLPDRCPEVVYSKLGRIKDFDAFVKQITEKLRPKSGKKLGAFLLNLLPYRQAQCFAQTHSLAFKDEIYNPGQLKPRDSVLKVKVGDKAPDFTLPSLWGKKISLHQFWGKKNVVLSFVPAAWTPVCSDQWPGYNLAKEIFDQYNAILLGISVDNIPTLYAWTRQMGNLWFPVLSDFWPHGKVASLYGILRSDGMAERALFVIDKQGIIRYIDIHDINKRPLLDDLVQALQKLEK